MSEKTKRILYTALCAGIIIAIVWLVFDALWGRKASVETDEEAVGVTEEQQTQIVEIEKLVEVERTVTAEMIQEGLSDMGVLITEEYYFTQVETYEKTKQILKYFTSSANFTYSYDGVVGAGINFEDISVEKDDEANVVYITLPDAEIQYCNIDYESFQIYSEKDELWNPLSMEDYNDAMTEFESKAREKAKEKNVLERAEENAKTLVWNFVGSMVDTSEYNIEWR